MDKVICLANGLLITHLQGKVYSVETVGTVRGYISFFPLPCWILRLAGILPFTSCTTVSVWFRGAAHWVECPPKLDLHPRRQFLPSSMHRILEHATLLLASLSKMKEERGYCRIKTWSAVTGFEHTTSIPYQVKSRSYYIP